MSRAGVPSPAEAVALYFDVATLPNFLRFGLVTVSVFPFPPVRSSPTPFAEEGNMA